MRFEPLAIVIVLALLPASSPARVESEHIRKSDLSSRSFVVGDLKITIKRFSDGSILTRGYIEVTAENTSDVATTFNPQRLSFVGKDGRQVNIRGRRQKGPVRPDDRTLDVAQAREVAPRAHVKELYELDGRVRLPAGLFYEGKDLALIVK
jgi:hypothetical protein